MLTNIQKSISKKNILTLKIDLNKSYGESGSGKSLIIASSRGNVGLKDTDGIKIGVNVYKKLDK